MRTRAAATVIVVLLAPLALAQTGGAPWSQAGGDMGRASVASLSGRTLDILATFSFLEPGETVSPAGPSGLVETRAGAGAVATRPGECRIVHVDAGTWAARPVGERYPCEDALRTGAAPVRLSAVFSGLAIGSVPEENAILVSVSAGPGGDLLRLVSLDDGSILWSARSERAPADQSVHTAVGAATDTAERLVIVPVFSADGGIHARLHVFDLDTGALLWARPISTAWRGALSEIPAPTSEFLPIHAALTPRGIVLNGLLGGGAQASGGPPALAWLTRDGRVTGAQAFGADTGQTPGTRALPTRAHSEWAATWGDRAAWATPEGLVVVDVENPTPRIYPLERIAAAGTLEIAPPAWWQEHLLVPAQDRLYAIAPADGTPLWSTPWPAPPSAFILHVIIVPPGTAYVVTTVQLTDRNELTLHRLALDTGEEMMRLPLPLDVGTDVGRFDGTMLPLVARDEILVWTDDGRAAILGAATGAPPVDVSDDYPAVSAPVTVTLPADASGFVHASIAWGDGAIETAQPGESRAHQYADARPRTLRVTAFRADGTSATHETTIHVGAPRPRELSAIQQAFEPDNQEITFFVIGLAITGGGALLATILQRRRHARLTAEERELRGLVEAAARDPIGGLALLDEHRAHLREAHTKRRLDDAQFALLDQRTVRAMKASRYRLLGDALNHLTPRFRRLLDTALEDGQVTHGEMHVLVEALANETALPPGERARIAELLDAWAR